MLFRTMILLSFFSVASPPRLSANVETMENVSYCQLAKDPNAFSGKRIRIRAIYSYMFEVSSLKSPTCCPDHGALIWVDFDEEKVNSLLRQLPNGMGTVLAVFVGKIETGRIYGPFGEKVRFVVDRIERVEKRARTNRNRQPDWFPRNCILRRSHRTVTFDRQFCGC